MSNEKDLTEKMNEAVEAVQSAKDEWEDYMSREVDELRDTISKLEQTIEDLSA